MVLYCAISGPTRELSRLLTAPELLEAGVGAGAGGGAVTRPAGGVCLVLDQ